MTRHAARCCCCCCSRWQQLCCCVQLQMHSCRDNRAPLWGQLSMASQPQHDVPGGGMCDCIELHCPNVAAQVWTSQCMRIVCTTAGSASTFGGPQVQHPQCQVFERRRSQKCHACMQDRCNSAAALHSRKSRNCRSASALRAPHECRICRAPFQQVVLCSAGRAGIKLPVDDISLNSA